MFGCRYHSMDCDSVMISVVYFRRGRECSILSWLTGASRCMVDNKLSWVKVVPAWKEGGRPVHRDDGIGIGSGTKRDLN
jgi:hypothetical protein